MLTDDEGSVAPAITGSAAPSACGGCYVIAGVAAVVFGEELVQTATQVVSVGIGKNGTTVTTSYAVPGVEFSFNPSGLLTGSEPGPTFAPGTVITISGATLYDFPLKWRETRESLTRVIEPLQLLTTFSLLSVKPRSFHPMGNV